MRLLMVGPSRSIAMRRVVAWALDAGHQVCLADTDERAGLAARPGLHRTPFQTGATDARQGADGTERLEYETGMRRIRELADRFRPDVTHAHYRQLPAACCAGAELRPFVVSAWGALNGLLHGPPWRSDAGPWQRILDAADRVIVESPALVEACRHLANPPCTALIPLGTDSRRFHPGQVAQRTAWRQTLRIPQEAVVLLSPRGWGRLYNQHQILEAYALARPRCRRPTVLVFVQLGRSAHEGDSLRLLAHARERARELGLDGAIRWLPALPYEMMPSFYALGDMVLNYPVEDAFPSSLIEAAACALPIITARLPAYAGTFVEAHGTLVEPNHPAALADAIAASVDQPPEANAGKLQTARAAIVAQYDERSAREQLFRLYQEVAGAGQGERAATDPAIWL